MSLHLIILLLIQLRGGMESLIAWRGSRKKRQEISHVKQHTAFISHSLSGLNDQFSLKLSYYTTFSKSLNSLHCLFLFLSSVIHLFLEVCAQIWTDYSS